MTFGKRFGSTAKSRVAGKNGGFGMLRVWVYAGLTAALMSCGGDPSSEETPLGSTQQGWTSCGESFTFEATVGTPGTYAPSGLLGLPPHGRLAINSGVPVVGDIQAELTWSQQDQPGEDDVDYTCLYKLNAAQTRLDLHACTPGMPPGDPSSFGPPLETDLLTLTITVSDHSARRVYTRMGELGPAPTCADPQDECIPVTEGQSCDDSSTCNGSGTCSPAGRCLEGSNPIPDDSDPCTLDACGPCTPIDRTVATNVADTYEFLYTGPNAVQTGLDEGGLKPERVSVVRGRALTLDDLGVDLVPVHGAKVTVLPLNPNEPIEPDFGETHSLSDGHYQMVTHGGGEVTVVIDHPDYLPVMRRELVLPNDARHFGDVVLTKRDSAPDLIDLDDLAVSSTPVVAEGPEVIDARGTRTVKVLFKDGTTTKIVTDPLDPTPGTPFGGELDFYITEFTVGEAGPAAMPATLPPTSGYTYAVELGFEGVGHDEHVRFSHASYAEPVIAYVDATQFLTFETGAPMPLGWLNRSTGAWVAGPSGRVIEITGEVTCGAAMCAVLDGDTGLTPAPDTLELQTLAAEFDTGDVLWRLPLEHLSSFDANCGLFPPVGATVASGEPTVGNPVDNPNCQTGSEIECESQVLGESLPVVGTPLSLHYRTDRVQGRTSTIDISLDYDHPDLVAADVSLYVAGTYQFAEHDAPLPTSHTFTWDQRDFLGRLVQGAQKAIVVVGLSYSGSYADTGVFNLPPMTGGTTVGTNVRLTRTWIIDLGHFVAEPLELGGWTLGQHHFYDPNARRLYYGDGRRKSADAKSSQVVRTVLGGAASTGCPDNDPDPLGVHILSAQAITTGPDGSLYLANGSGTCWSLHRVTPAGDHELVWSESNNDGSITGLARGPDGSFYLSRNHGNALRVDRLPPGSSTLETFAGDGGDCSPGNGACGDGDAALEAQLADPESLVVTPDGTVYIADQDVGRIRRVDPNGDISTIAGTGQTGCGPPLSGGLCGGQGDLATNVGLGSVEHLTLMPDGTLVFEAGGGRIVAVTTDGRIWRVSGFGTMSPEPETEGLPVNTLTLLTTLRGLAAMPDGRLLIALQDRLLAVRPPLVVPVSAPNGSFATLAGGYASASCTNFNDCGDGLEPTAAKYATNGAVEDPIAVGPDGRIFIVNGFDRVFALEPLLPDFGVAWQIPSEDATELYTFDESGRHLGTLDARTGTPLFTFAYGDYDGDADDGLLLTVTDVHGRNTSIARPAGLVEITGPFAHKTTMTLDTAGIYAESIATPAGRTFGFTYDDDPAGLMLEMTTPRDYDYVFTHDPSGRLLTDADPAGGLQTLAFTQLQATSQDPFGYRVTNTRKNTATTSLDVTGYELLSAGAGVTHRTVTWPLGDPNALQTVIGEVGDGLTQTIAPDGTNITVTRLPEQRWGMLAPTGSVVVWTGGDTTSVSLDRGVTLSNPSDPLSLTKLTETVTVDGHAWDSELVLNTTPATFEIATPEDRTIDVDLDTLLRPTAVAVPGIEELVITYHPSGTHEGYIDKLEQGTLTNKRLLDFTYDGDGRLWKVLDPENRETIFTYDDDGLPLTATLPDLKVVNLAFDLDGNLSEVDPPGTLAGLHELGYSPVDLLASYEPPLIPATAVGWTQTPDRQLDVFTSPVATIDADYDAFGRLEDFLHGTEPLAIDYYPFDDSIMARRGKLESVAASLDGTTMTFDYAGALIAEVELTGPVAATVGWTYQTGLLVETETVTADGTPHAISYGYDNDRLLSQAGDLIIHRDPGGTDMSGLLWSTEIQDITDEYTYNDFGEVEYYQALLDATDNLYEVYYERDMLGRVVRRAERVGTGNVEVREYEYHLRGWLEKVWVGTGSCTVSTCDCAVLGTCVVGEEYAYDDNGNRTAASGSLVVDPDVSATDYDAQDRQWDYGSLVFDYDDAGQRDQRTAGTDDTFYSYSPYGELRQVELPDTSIVSYVLDPNGRRAGKKVGGTLQHGWLWGAELGPIAELDPITMGMTRRYVYGTRAWVPDYIDAGATNYRVITDELGSVRLVVNTTTGAIAQELRYNSFGRILTDTNPGFQPFGFAGGMYDPDTGAAPNTGLVRFGARDYDPEVGRWTTKDPGGFSGGLNLYVYAHNDPINFIDPTGNSPVLVGAVLGGVSYGLIYVLTEDYNDISLGGYIVSAGAGAALGAGAGYLGGAGVGLGTSALTWGRGLIPAAGGLITAIGNKVQGCSKPALMRQQLKGISSLQKQIVLHEQKLAQFKANPTPRPGTEHLSKKIQQQSIDGRIKHLEKEIQTFQENIGKIRKGKP